MRFKFPFWARSVAAYAAVVVLIFTASGRLDYWQGWIYIAINLAILVVTAFLMRNEHGLVAERLRPGKGMKSWDKAYYLLSTPLWVTAIVLACVDEGRRHWSRHPAAILYLAFLAVYIAGQGLFVWARKVNPFFSSVARIQADRGQSVCREGPYRFCRHPGYLGGVLFGLATPLVLGSYWALIPQGLAVLLLIVRTELEDRMLMKELLWYAEYAKAVPFRLVPGLW
jgi:protein-S-isoprenylcysteine O-methyltransferase Ste14